MEDGKIIDLYFCRSERALLETENKYGKLCRAISYNILNNIEGTSSLVCFCRQISCWHENLSSRTDEESALQ